jgi:predicted NAD/FAD-dependent oxidoreductase
MLPYCPDWTSPQLAAAGLSFDHAAQCFTATDPAFRQQVQAWLEAGVVRQWRGPVGTLSPGGRFNPLDPEVELFVAPGGMRKLAQAMADEVRKPY